MGLVSLTRWGVVMKERFLHIAAVWGLFAGVALAGPGAAQAQNLVSGAWVSADYAQVRLIAGAEKEKAGLEVRLAPGWHAYWRMPGDGGLAPQLDWADSGNVKDVTVSWPVPRRFEDMELQSFGYENSFILPLNVAAKDPAQDVKMLLDLNLMVCEKICVPQKMRAMLDVPAAGAAGAQGAVLAAVRLPHEGDLPDLKIENMVIGPEALVARVYAEKGFSRFDLFVENSSDVYVTAKPEITIDSKDPLYAQVRIAAPAGVENLYEAITGERVILTATDGENAIERRYDF